MPEQTQPHYNHCMIGVCGAARLLVSPLGSDAYHVQKKKKVVSGAASGSKEIK